ncbi:MAG: aminotransferase class I/II-fold pyridoxal phosphate-dependent enzyme, partial [candidate division NC10 bacterium]
GALAALNDTDHLEETVRITEAGRRNLQSRLEELGLLCIPSVANFILVNVRLDGRAIADALLRKGIIVRSMEGYGLPTHIRVTVGTAQENTRAIKALAEVLGDAQTAVRSWTSPGGRSTQ